MKIISVEVGEVRIPLKKTFASALRRSNYVNNCVVRITGDNGMVGLGEAAATPTISGETKKSIMSAISDYIAPAIIDLEIFDFDNIMRKLHNSIAVNFAAKAAIDMALYDLYTQALGVPLYDLLGGRRRELKTDINISLGTIDHMVSEAIRTVNAGFDILKIKVGLNDGLDFERIKQVHKAIGSEYKLRIDATQAWKPKEAVRIIRRIEDAGIDVEFIEQPVAARDVNGLKFVRDNVMTPIMADEAVFSFDDAIDVLRTQAADMISVKLMKAGGIYNALKICAAAECYGIDCMMSCMLESKIAISAAAHLAAAKDIIKMVDLDGVALCSSDPVIGGPRFEEDIISMSDIPGIGFSELRDNNVLFF